MLRGHAGKPLQVEGQGPVEQLRDAEPRDLVQLDASERRAASLQQLLARVHTHRREAGLACRANVEGFEEGRSHGGRTANPTDACPKMTHASSPVQPATGSLRTWA